MFNRGTRRQERCYELGLVGEISFFGKCLLQVSVAHCFSSSRRPSAARAFTSIHSLPDARVSHSSIVILRLKWNMTFRISRNCSSLVLVRTRSPPNTGRKYSQQ